MRPAEPLSANLRGVAVDQQQLDGPRALAMLAAGTRAERRAAARWLRRHAAAPRRQGGAR